MAANADSPNNNTTFSDIDVTGGPLNSGMPKLGRGRALARRTATSSRQGFAVATRGHGERGDKRAYPDRRGRDDPPTADRAQTNFGAGDTVIFNSAATVDIEVRRNDDRGERPRWLANGGSNTIQVNSGRRAFKASGSTFTINQVSLNAGSVLASAA